ncbi:ribosomal-protein-serine acetyltransferase [Caldalkalibacillus uzonensis]|uniref:Ribosomal-protein-serine acetyltransferase n=1 Tax=Caldalkalibacillus uzonensis TaxID=353224 RepID=A0ABU0CQ37_9BACI|nr:GNAT family protein [Caldalkalibacillus uzonensis]MDQ0338527.1 ribosomal-protein-serine acetyltransferase [Caldalkalibacillus uzonensis]
MFLHQIEEDLELRLLQLYHADELFRLADCNRPHLHKWLPWLDFTISVTHARDFIKTTLQQYAHNGGFKCGIWYNGELAGLIGYHKIDWANKNTNLEYWIGKSFSGKGIMTKACRAMVDHSFTHLKLHRIEIRCAVENKKSRAIPERLGFVFEGIIREAEWLYDHYVDHAVYGMLDREWKPVNR